MKTNDFRTFLMYLPPEAEFFLLPALVFEFLQLKNTTFPKDFSENLCIQLINVGSTKGVESLLGDGECDKGDNDLGINITVKSGIMMEGGKVFKSN